MSNDPLAAERGSSALDAARGILNGVVAGVILWAGIAVLLFYGFHKTL